MRGQLTNFLSPLTNEILIEDKRMELKKEMKRIKKEQDKKRHCSY